ncbi:hypothetical protein F5Y05DRAFT_408727 [Hypoxylon sp. FL0543]|nr:hypothetical protein F5Y05DRAFT_408727 [Hypoxylon sp. FL0543]
MNAAIDPTRKFEEWSDESPWTPPMFTSPFGDGIPIPDPQFWASSGNNSEEYYRPNLHTMQEELGHGIDAGESYDTSFTMDNAIPTPGSFVCTQPIAASQIGQLAHQFDDQFAGQRRYDNDEETGGFYDPNAASSVGTSTASYKGGYSSRSPEIAKFSPQSSSALSPTSGSSVNWMTDGTVADPRSPSSPTSSINVQLADPVNRGSAPTKNRRNRERNRVAAHKCRQKAKQSMSDLQIRERELSQQNRLLQEHAGSLRDEILDLKNEILRHSECNSDIIQNYIAKAARDVK